MFNLSRITKGESEALMITQLNLPVLDLLPELIATADKRYINTYYYSGESWYLVKNAKRIDEYNIWHLRKVDLDGKPLESTKITSVDLKANMFADRPFIEDESEIQWFANMVSASTSFEVTADTVLAKYEEYLLKRRHCCSYDSLIRIGLKDPIENSKISTRAALENLFKHKGY